MGKYDPLREYLRRQSSDQMELSFRQIEGQLGYMLPNAAAREDWWACPGDPGPREVQKSALRSAGFSADLIAQDRVRFTRLAKISSD